MTCSGCGQIVDQFVSERRQIHRGTEAQAQHLRSLLEAQHGLPHLDRVEVADDGSLVEHETWAPDLTTTTTRTPRNVDA